MAHRINLDTASKSYCQLKILLGSRIPGPTTISCSVEVGEVSFDAEELNFSLICSFQIIAQFLYPILVVPL